MLADRLACIYWNSSTNKKPPSGGILFVLAGPTGFEPAISSVTGRRVRPATPRAHDLESNYAILAFFSVIGNIRNAWSHLAGSNC